MCVIGAWVSSSHHGTSTLRDHELNHHTLRCIDMFSHDCNSDLMFVLSKKIPYNGIAKIDPQLALKRQAKVVIYGM